jgi:uncharacterized membrane protein
MDMDSIKDLLVRYGQPFLVKYAARVVLYGATAISAKLSIQSPDADTQAKVTDWIVTAGLAGLAMLVDYWRHVSDQQQAAPTLAAKVDSLKVQVATLKDNA